jgi:hypothetical protein
MVKNLLSFRFISTWQLLSKKFELFCQFLLLSMCIICLSFCLSSGTGVWTLHFVLARQMFYLLSHTSSLFWSVYFGDEVLWPVCQVWLEILLISASWVARIIGMSSQHLVEFLLSLTKKNPSAFFSPRISDWFLSVAKRVIIMCNYCSDYTHWTPSFKFNLTNVQA